MLNPTPLSRFYVDPKSGIVYSYPDPTKINIREICDSRCTMSATAVDNEGASDAIQLAIVPVGEEEIVALEVTDGGMETGIRFSSATEKRN